MPIDGLVVGVNILGANRDVRRFNTFYDDGEQINALLLNFPHFSKEAREVIEPVVQASKKCNEIRQTRNLMMMIFVTYWKFFFLDLMNC